MEILVAPQTTITRDEKPAELSDLQSDDIAVITAESQGDTMIAVSVFVMEPR
jgi:hypothetical protein